MVQWSFLGRTDYQECWELQQSLFRLRIGGGIPDRLLLTEHEPVYTMGRNGSALHVLASDDELKTRGVTVVECDRGGDITFHGPGQLVAYPILDLRGYGLDLHRYLRDLEEVVIRAVAGFGIQGGRVPGYTGVWVDGEKLCAIGIKSSRWFTMHGFALNVSTDLSYFGRIIPCGILERGVTSIEELTGARVSMGEVVPKIVSAFEEVFRVALDPLPAGELRRTAHAGEPSVL